MAKRKCLTPGAYWFFEKDDWSPAVRFSVSMTRETFEKLSDRKCRQLEKAFHDSIEPILAEVWEKP